MYEDEIKVANKIITDKDLVEIFQKMDEDIKENVKLNEKEKIENEKYELEYQHWTIKNFEGSFKCTFNFYDSTTITVDNYNSFTTLFNTRLDEIKNMWVRYSQKYSIVDGRDNKFIANHIYMNIYEDKMTIDVSISSEDNKMNDIYELIKEKILKAPPRYTRMIKKRGLIKNKIIIAFGIIPSTVLCTLLAFMPTIREANNGAYFLYPLAILLIGYLIGNIIVGSKLNSLYETLVPDKEYVGYNKNTSKSIYKDNINKYLDTSEILIGKNINNIKYRKEIRKMEKKYSSYLPIEIAVILALSILVPIITSYIK